ncbi:hypothetical protein Pcinc_024496 [Petrolisthes cinctipes]|uniref:Methyltransferase domain-containing protein n=1 Tax=Petrolisthes cinctipes TaxID=88211 RepID=A0AAE1F2D8_PETCI|nr:hypothetical protein Pcinc_028701 [Petrolisthes cinctipes]KAK3870259.1 hypothetical protein Pcinc_024496 [Petrolisthes cinctipes]
MHDMYIPILPRYTRNMLRNMTKKQMVTLGIIAFCTASIHLASYFQLRKISRPLLQDLTGINLLQEGRGWMEGLCLPQKLTSETQFFEYFNISKEKQTCQNWRIFGEGDGKDHAKHVCLDDDYHIQPDSCLVLSYGITNWSFEDDFDKFGCTVFALDPLLPLEKQQEFNDNINFLDMGLASFSGRSVAKMQGKKVFISVTRLENLLADLKLDEMAVDYLKLDVAGTEEDILQDLLLTSPQVLRHVKQISMTLLHHPSTVEVPSALGSQPVGGGGEEQLSLEYGALWTYIQLLHCNYFRLLWSRQVGPSAHEVVWGRIPQPDDEEDNMPSISWDY